MKKEGITKKIFLILAFLVAAAFAFFTSAKGKESKQADYTAEPLTIRGVFEKLKTPALELVGRSKRLDMLDYFDADSVLRVRNDMNGISYLDTVTADYLRFRPTAVSIFEIKLLPYKKGKIAMTLYTVGASGQSPDTEINFYDVNLNLLENKHYFALPEFKQLFKPMCRDKNTLVEMADLVPFPTLEFHADAENTVINGNVTVGEFLSKEAREKVDGCLVKSLKYVWNGSRFEPADK